jgi:hypothetical protein
MLVNSIKLHLMVSFKTASTILASFALIIIFEGCVKSSNRADEITPPGATAGKAISGSDIEAARTLPAGALIPDLQTVIPQHLQVVHAHQQDILRFSNGIANTGVGALQLQPEYPIEGSSEQTQNAIQQLLNASGAIVYEEVVSEFEYHPDHNHWHIDAVALFELRSGSPTGPIVGNNSLKTTFCLIDWVKLEGNSNSKERVYFDCFGVQGISPGWVDQYNQAVEGQELNITNVPPGRYYLVSTSNPEQNLIESNYTNNTAWVSFNLHRDRHDRPKITLVAHSACTGRLCGFAPNR